MLGVAQIFSPAANAGAQAAQESAKVGRAQEAKLQETAKEFEATLVSLLLKEMRQSLDPKGGLFPGDDADVQGGLFDMFLSKHLADAGGVGIAASLMDRLRAASTLTKLNDATHAPGFTPTPLLRTA